MTNEVEVSNVGFADRRYITVVSDAEFMSLKSQGDMWQTAAGVLLDAAPVIISLSPGGILFRSALQISVPALKRYVQSRHERQTMIIPKEEAILKVCRSAVSAFNFGALGIEKNLVYAVNPMDPLKYGPLASFHNDMIAHKVGELQRLLNHLGATRYSITHLQERSRRTELTAEGGKGLVWGQS